MVLYCVADPASSTGAAMALHAEDMDTASPSRSSADAMAQMGSLRLYNLIHGGEEESRINIIYWLAIADPSQLQLLRVMKELLQSSRRNAAIRWFNVLYVRHAQAALGLVRKSMLQP